jgi:hypothetical protein
MRIPDRLLIHELHVARRKDLGGSTRPEFDDTEQSVPCITVDRRRLVIDQRADSETSGREILANTHVLVQPEKFAPPGSKVTVWPGKPQERLGVVVATAYAEHDKAPSSAQMWIL